MRVPFLVAMIAITGSCGLAAGVSLLDASPVRAPIAEVHESPVLVLDAGPVAQMLAAPANVPVDVAATAARVLTLESERVDRIPRLMLLPDGALVTSAMAPDAGALVRELAERAPPATAPLESATLPRTPPAAQLARIDDAGVSTYFAGKRAAAPAPAPMPQPSVFTPQATSAQSDINSYWAAGFLAAAGAAAVLGLALYHRIRPNAALENETRKLIFDAVCAAPGLGVHEVSKLAGVSYSTATYHLERLVGAGMIVMTPDGNKLCYYKNGGAFTESERRILPLIKNEEAAKLFEAILQSPGTYRAALAEQLGVTATTINWHLRRLREAGLVDETRAGRSAHLYAKIEALRPVFLTLATKVETTEPTIAIKLRTYATPPPGSATSASA